MTAHANSNGHGRWEGDVAAYALGALEEHELRRFEEHLAACEQCQDDLAAMRSAVEALPALAPFRPAPPELKQRVMGLVRDEAALQAAADPAARRERGQRARLILPWGRWPVPVLAAAATVLVALVVVIGVLSLGGGGSVRTYEGVAYAPGASASVRVSGGHARLVFARLPPVPAQLIYQMWVKRGANAPVPAGALFETTSGAVAVPGGVRGVEAVLVTAERRPYGSQVPTRKPIIVVRLT
jgi:anti-sigma-K factor RskA